jgi:hypothetical protein
MMQVTTAILNSVRAHEGMVLVLWAEQVPWLEDGQPLIIYSSSSSSSLSSSLSSLPAYLSTFPAWASSSSSIPVGAMVDGSIVVMAPLGPIVELSIDVAIVAASVAICTIELGDVVSDGPPVSISLLGFMVESPNIGMAVVSTVVAIVIAATADSGIGTQISSLEAILSSEAVHPAIGSPGLRCRHIKPSLHSSSLSQSSNCNLTTK